MKAKHLEIPYFDAQTVLPGLSKEPGLIFLDSANHSHPLENTNRYSYICYRPIDYLYLKNAVLDESPFASLQCKLKAFPQTPEESIPPFQGGAMGCFSYDLCHYFEKIPRVKHDKVNFPDMLVGIYDVVVSFDHRLKKSWIVSTGYPHYDQKTRMKNAEYRLQQVYAEIVAAQSQTTLAPVVGKKMRSNFSKQAYEQAVSHARQYILAGDIFEVNLSQQFHAKLDSPEEAMGLYLQLRQTNPAPFSAYLKFDEFVLASASPERFLKVKNRQVESRPIKGTIAVSKDWAENEKNKNALLNSEKDRAENTMIVDLMRNDFSRVCEPNSVVVEKLCGLETYEAVHHLVSVIRGTLQDNKDAIDLLAVSFPGGSITGAPKIRAMQIISELERRPRGPHYGSVGYISFSGDMDTSILIRSFAIEGTDVTLQAGGAITLDSDPSLEYEESLLKAASCQKALECSL